MRVFISQVDSSLGHNLSRLLSQTVVGSRRSTEENDNESNSGENEGENDEGDVVQKDEPKNKFYEIAGTLTDLSSKSEDELLAISKRGQMVESGNKEEDDKRRTALEKFSVYDETPRWVEEVVPFDDTEAVKAAVLRSDYIIFDLNNNAAEAQAIAEWLNGQAESFSKRPKTLIAISSVMTWARTKATAGNGNEDEEEGQGGVLVEDDYRRRKPHPNFRNIWNAEKAITKLGKKSSFRSYVVAPGLIYHTGDCIFHPFLKSGWLNERELTVYGDGNNVLPTIHLDNLCEILLDVMESPPATHYVVAVDSSSNTQLEIVTAISEELTTGKIRHVAPEEAYLNSAFSQAEIDMLTASVQIEQGCVRDMGFTWKFESGIVENIAAYVQEYKNARGLFPINAVVHGPPASGKTSLAHRLAEHYSLHYIDAQQIMKSLVEELSGRVNASFAAAENATESSAADGAGASANSGSVSGTGTHDIEEDRALLEELKEFSAKNSGSFPPQLVIEHVRRKLLSKPCGNQGYVLDDFPGSTEEAGVLFGVTEEEAEELNPGGEGVQLYPRLQPGFIFGLECSDQTVKERAMNLPEPDCLLYKNTQEGFLRRLEKYRAENTDENTILNFYDEHELLTIALNANPPNTAEQVAAQAQQRIGLPRNFGPKVDEIKRRRRVEEEERAKVFAAQEQERQRQTVEEELRKQKEYIEWKKRMDEIHSQEKEALEAQSAPLRSYLMKNIMPTLTQALVQVCKVRPSDSIDYIAEYLFKHGSIAEESLVSKAAELSNGSEKNNESV